MENLSFGEQKDIQEVKNAYNAYEQIDKVNPYIDTFTRKNYCKHQILMLDYK